MRALSEEGETTLRSAWFEEQPIVAANVWDHQRFARLFRTTVLRNARTGYRGLVLVRAVVLHAIRRHVARVNPETARGLGILPAKHELLTVEGPLVRGFWMVNVAVGVKTVNAAAREVLPFGDHFVVKELA